jgi:hypothetical protein
MSNGHINFEKTGIYSGVLQEDMIVTVSRTKRSYMNVFYEGLVASENIDYPLTYLPAYGMVYPLREGDIVWSYFNQKNMRYPVFWRVDAEYTTQMYENWSPPSPGSIVTPPNEQDTIGVIQLSEDAFILSTEEYTVLRYGDNAYMFGAEGNLVMGTKFAVLTDVIQLEANQSLDTLAQNSRIESSIKTTLAGPGCQLWVPNALANCPFTGAPHGGTPMGITGLDGDSPS